MHRLLKRQIRKYLSIEQEGQLSEFLNAVDEAYLGFDSDLGHLENILEKSSQELFKANQELKKAVVSKTEEIEKTHSKLESVMNNVNEVIFQTNSEGEWIYLNPMWEKITGFKIDSSIGRKTFDFIHPLDIEGCKNKVRELVSGGIHRGFNELRLLTNEGGFVWCELTVRATSDVDGNINGLTGTFKDISERKRLELENKKNEEKYKLIFEKSSVAYLVIKKAQFIECNQACLDLFGVKKREDFLLKNVLDFSPEFQPDGLLSGVKAMEMIQKGKSNGFNKFDWIHKKEDGTEFPVEVALNSVNLMDGNVLFVVLNDLMERKAVEQELILAKEKAEDATSAKAQFLSTMSHEIRTPMNAVIGVTHLLSEDDPREDQIQNLNILKLSADNLMTLINDILDFSKIEAGRVDLEAVDFNFRSLVGNIASGFKVKSKEKGLDLIVDVDPKIPAHVIGDPMRISQVLNNLCSNAIKFTEKGSVKIKVVFLGVDKNIVNLQFQVSDTGIGIPMNKQDQIFNSFSQADSNTTRIYGGTGLGLTISKKLIEIMNGSISVESLPEKGTTFMVNLDLSISHKSMPKVGFTTESIKDIDKVKGLHVLVAEDNEMNILIIKQFLKKWEISYEIAMNGQIAFDKVKTGNFDMVLMDLQMPIMDGYHTTINIRKLKEERFVKLPILAITASAFSEIRKKVLEAGMNDFVTKPINPDELFAKIEKYVN